MFLGGLQDHTRPLLLLGSTGCQPVAFGRCAEYILRKARPPQCNCLTSA